MVGTFGSPGIVEISREATTADTKAITSLCDRARLQRTLGDLAQQGELIASAIAAALYYQLVG